MDVIFTLPTALIPTIRISSLPPNGNSIYSRERVEGGQGNTFAVADGRKLF